MSAETGIRIISTPITRAGLAEIARESFGDLAKAVVDIAQERMALGGELHADEEAALLANGSQPANLWGINLYPDAPPDQFIEFDSLINIRPRQNNRSRGVEDSARQKKIREVVQKLIV